MTGVPFTEGKPPARVRCPCCKKDVGLWESVELAGWRAIDDHGQATNKGGWNDRDVDWDSATPDGYVGCGECSWEGRKADLERVGLNGEPLPTVHPQQERLV